MAEVNEYDQPGRYEIKVMGKLAERWSEWFDDFEIRSEQDTTILTGLVTDQAALHGLLNKVRDIGLPLLSIQRVRNEENH